MKLSEMKAAAAGIPAGFTGTITKWTNVKECFTIEKCACIQREVLDENGQPIVRTKGANAGKPVYDRQLIFQLKGESRKAYIVRTNSPMLRRLFGDQIANGKAETVNRYGAGIIPLEPPEGKLCFVPADYEYADGTIGQVADLAEVVKN